MKAEATSGGVRKGAWSHQEDNLLRQCIEKYGEGKWHQVPVRAGLNRCRKSCRLRWLNYLKPDIKRGEFGADEVDLLLRLHKLLGNRWSLIAGRIPGRTANDVKNYWNTHQQKKLMPKSQEKTEPEDINQDDDHLVLTKTTVFKPRARTFSKDPPRCSTGQIAPASSVSIHPSQDGSGSDIPAPQLAAADDGSQWWDDLFGDQMKDIGRNKEEDHEPIEPTFWADQLLTAQLLDENSVQAGPNDFWVDMDFF